MPDTLMWMGAAFIVVWVALGLYLWRLWRVQRRLSERLSRIEGAGGVTPPGPGDSR